MEKDLSKLSYEELEKEAEEVLKQLSDSSLPLDKAHEIYQYGKKISAEMDVRLEKLSKEVTDTISK